MILLYLALHCIGFYLFMAGNSRCKITGQSAAIDNATWASRLRWPSAPTRVRAPLYACKHTFYSYTAIQPVIKQKCFRNKIENKSGRAIVYVQSASFWSFTVASWRPPRLLVMIPSSAAKWAPMTKWKNKWISNNSSREIIHTAPTKWRHFSSGRFLLPIAFDLRQQPS